MTRRHMIWHDVTWRDMTFDVAWRDSRRRTRGRGRAAGAAAAGAHREDGRGAQRPLPGVLRPGWKAGGHVVQLRH